MFSVITSTPISFGFFVAFVFLMTPNLLQVKRFSYTDLAFIIPIFIKLRPPKTPEPTISYNSEERIKEYIEDILIKPDKAYEEKLKRKREKERIQKQIDRKIEEVIKKLEGF